MAAVSTQLGFVPNKVAAVCYRGAGRSVEFLLVRTKSGKWTFPKGNVEPHLELHESAELEAYEEAGAMGRIASGHFEMYLHDKRCTRDSESGKPIVAAYLLEVEQTIPPQEFHREPTWFKPDEAKWKLAKGRSRRIRREFSRVIDNAVSTVYAGKSQSRRGLTSRNPFRWKLPRITSQ